MNTEKTSGAPRHPESKTQGANADSAWFEPGGAGNPALDERVAHLARALWREYDYALGVDPNALALFCVRALARHDAELIERISDDFDGVYDGQGYWAALAEVRERIVDGYLA